MIPGRTLLRVDLHVTANYSRVLTDFHGEHDDGTIAIRRGTCFAMSHVDRDYATKAAREPGAEVELAHNASARLAMLRLVRMGADGVDPLPALARFALGDAEKVARKHALRKGAERAQDSLF